MARNRKTEIPYGRSLQRVLMGITFVFLIAVFLFWRIDNPRVERFRISVVDRVLPSFEWLLVPVTKAARMIEDFQSYNRIYEQNQELRRELQRLKGWREAALQLEEKNARLLNLNNVRLDPKLTFITGVVMTDSGSPFNRSALVNVGAMDGILDGWAAMDGFGLVGRISGVGTRISRVVLLTDTDSRVPVSIQPSGQKAIMMGLNSPSPVLEFLAEQDEVQAGDRVVSSGDGGVFPAGLLAGQVKISKDGRLFVQLAADYQRLEFLRILRAPAVETVKESDAVIGLQNQMSDAATEAEDG